MSKNVLLPKEYNDTGIQSSIFVALSPYKINDRSDIVNPHLKWNLQQAWKNAEELLAKAQWLSRGHRESALDQEYEISADTDDEINTLNAMIAGIVAYQLIEDDSGIALKRVDYRKGGEMAIIISGEVLQKLKQILPALPDSATSGGKKRWWSMLNWKPN